MNWGRVARATVSGNGVLATLFVQLSWALWTYLSIYILDASLPFYNGLMLDPAYPILWLGSLTLFSSRWETLAVHHLIFHCQILHLYQGSLSRQDLFVEWYTVLCCTWHVLAPELQVSMKQLFYWGLTEFPLAWFSTINNSKYLWSMYKVFLRYVCGVYEVWMGCAWPHSLVASYLSHRWITYSVISCSRHPSYPAASRSCDKWVRVVLSSAEYFASKTWRGLPTNLYYSYKGGARCNCLSFTLEGCPGMT